MSVELEGDIIQALWHSPARELLRDMVYLVRNEAYDPRPNVATTISVEEFVEATAIAPVKIDLNQNITQTAQTMLILVRPSSLLWRPTIGRFTITNTARTEEWEVLSCRRLALSPRGEAWEFIVEGNVCP